MKNQFALVTLLAVVISLTMFSACNEKEEAPFLKSSDNGTTITAEGNSWSGWSTTLKSNIDQSDLRTSSTASWCTARLSALGNDYQLQVSAEDNPTLSARQAIVSVQSTDGQAAVSFTISQQPGKPYISFKDGDEDVTVDSQAKSLERTVDSNIEFSKLTVSSSEKWCSAKLENSGNGITLKLEIQENQTIEERKATITVKASTGAVNTSFEVIQQPSAPAISFVDGGENQTITPDAKSWTWEVSSNIEFKELEASSTADWCTVELSQATYSKKISLSVKVAKNETISNRQAVVTVKSTKYGTSLSFNVTQQAGTPTISFSGTEGKDLTVAAPAKVLDWTMLSNIPYSELKVASNESWCQVKLTVSNEAKDVKSYPLTITFAENPMDKQREAVVTISSDRYDVSKSFKVTQSAATFKSSHASVGFDRDANSRTVTITSNAAWKAECSADWVSLEQTNEYLTVRVKATAVNRSATITFKDKSSTTIVVNQTKYKVGDEYNEGGVTGTVAYIGDDKRFICKSTGKTAPYQQFFLSTGVTGTYNMDDGEVNMQFIKRQSGWSGNFLAAAAADDLSTGGITGWYLPAINELRNMKAFVSGSAWSSTANNNGSFSAYCLSGGTVYSNEDRQMKHGVIAIRKF